MEKFFELPHLSQLFYTLEVWLHLWGAFFDKRSSCLLLSFLTILDGDIFKFQGTKLGVIVQPNKGPE